MLMRLFPFWASWAVGFPHHVTLGSQADEPRAESAMGKGERSRTETQSHNISSRQKENRGRTAGTVGEAEGGKEIVEAQRSLRA